MSLREQIHDTLDEITPPAPDLERKVTTFVFAQKTQRRVFLLRPRRSAWVYRIKGAASLLAAALLVALVAGLIVGGHLLRDFQTSPGPAINQGELKRLEARPLVAMPPMPADGVCPAGPLGTDFIGGPAIGDGVVRSIIGGTPSTYHTGWGTWDLTAFPVDPTEKGLVLIRARDLRSGASAYFAGNITGVADANIGKAILAGQVAGQDRVNGQAVPLHPELVIDASAPSDFAKSKKAPTWVAFIGYPNGASRCIFFQVDYDHSTEKFVRAY